ncbi:hypothetical protein CISIN_1g0047092mg, partial [Citrus sinensis]
MPSNYL